jgi:hypothetical protein
MFHFSCVTIFEAFVERPALLDYSYRLLKIPYLIFLDDDRLARDVALPSDLSQLLFGKPFAYMALSKVSFPFLDGMGHRSGGPSAG